MSTKVGLDPWKNIIDSLVDANDEVHSGAANQPHANVYRFCSRTERAQVTVKLIECPTDDIVTIEWRDATKCCYREQIWRRGKANASGYCVLSGAKIRRGDDVYRPRMLDCVNAGAMILCTALQRHLLMPSIDLSPDIGECV
ncbi:hypothetical protein LMG27952_05081 [Paraburkholderia hiiakae]|uniref:DUF3331 domain-containing protein n=1 Tax=Paraburkholderia hiiakae TaxID=1081782 RepID=A0ABN7I909_9BURK|nr:DUF3331 domain-containing protein [Paraburkholderia hiiakae]CAD6550857.1 hypothetical protein LMG27952_05081 [Paraburkholderia hiiakae]